MGRKESNQTNKQNMPSGIPLISEPEAVQKYYLTFRILSRRRLMNA